MQIGFERFPGGRRRRRQHGITLAGFRRQRVGPRLGPAGVALLKQLEQVDFAVEQNLRHVMFVHVHDAEAGDELSD